ncbi:MAG: homocysteine S-methyltransferase family protein, partial [Planctomycetota bacterium]
MGRTSLKERVRQGAFLLDGAMGTQLFARGVEAGACNDYLNIESPDIVFDIHRAYLEAGSDAVLTNTFGANKYALARHGLSDKIREINTKAAQIARRAAGEEKYVLGALGNLNPAECKEAFTQQAKALVAGGVDGLIIETMTALDETAIAVEAVKSACGDLPVFASMSFDKAGDDFRTMMGVDVESAVSKMAALEVYAVGFNCGTTTLEEYIELAEKFVSAVKSLGKDIIIYAEPNAGKPELVENKAVYNVSPEDFAAAIEQIRKAGVTIIGGCCGTTPA